MNDEILNEQNYIIFCARHYVNPVNYSTDDFFEDLKRVRYIKKLCSKYENGGELKERLILNHIIVLCNSFGPNITSKILYFKLHSQFPLLKPFLLYLGILPDKLYNIGDENVIDTTKILSDIFIEQRLQEI